MTTTNDGVAAQASQSHARFTTRPKLHGRNFYRAIGEPKYIVAPMVDRSEFAWRMLTRSYLTPETSKQLLAYSPMIHARLFSDNAKFRDEYFQPTRSSLETTDAPPPETEPYLDGNPDLDRPLFVQFCANKPHELLAAARYVAPYCDAVDLNLGCPQGIAKSGHYGAFLQEDWSTIHSMINTLHNELDVPITAKMRILDTKEKTLEYAKMILGAGASILTVHGRRREQKSHMTGLADWDMIRFLRDNLPQETVLFANGNILNGGDLEECLRATGADGIMSAEGNLSDPTIFAKPPVDPTSREYWHSPVDGSVGGYRLDGVFRRYMDIIYRYVLEKEPPVRKPLWIPGDIEPETEDQDVVHVNGDMPKLKKKKSSRITSMSIRVMSGHLFGLLKPMLGTHTDIRDILARVRNGDFEGFERILSMVEEAVRKGLQEEAQQLANGQAEHNEGVVDDTEMTFSQRTITKYKRPWWVAQPYIRPLPEEAFARGAFKISEKDKAKSIKVVPDHVGKTLQLPDSNDSRRHTQPASFVSPTTNEPPRSTLVCG